MAVIIGSVRVTGFIAPSDSTDTYATHDEIYGRGGFRTVVDIAARNAITTDRRRIGMLVRVLDDGFGAMKFYTLIGGIADINWVEESFTGGGSTFRGHAVPVEAPNGFLATFTLPSSEKFQAGSLQVFLNGIKYIPANVAENLPGRTTFTISGDPPPETGSDLSISYVLG